MTKKDQVRFISGLSDAVLSSMIDTINADQVPENWDGHELRMWLKDRFALVVLPGVLTRKQVRDYKNTCLTNNLL